MTGSVKSGGDLTAAQALAAELPGQSYDLLFGKIRHKLLALSAPPEGGTPSRVATHCQLGCLPSAHPRLDERTFVLCDGPEHLAYPHPGRVVTVNVRLTHADHFHTCLAHPGHEGLLQ